MSVPFEAKFSGNFCERCDALIFAGELISSVGQNRYVHVHCRSQVKKMNPNLLLAAVSRPPPEDWLATMTPEERAENEAAREYWLDEMRKSIAEGAANQAKAREARLRKQRRQ